MLAFLAAAIPILGALFAGASFLIEHAGLRRERWVRERVQQLGFERREAAEERARIRQARDKTTYQSPVDEVSDFEEMMLAAYGYGRAPSMYQADISLAMSGSVASSAERIRQTVLLVTATVGVILLAFDAM